jgi:hypothetical protein
MIHRRSPWLTPDELLDLVSTNYDARNHHANGPARMLAWRRAAPPEPEHYDIAYEADYNGIIFRAIRSRSHPTTWRVERDNPSTGERQCGLSHEDSLLACKTRVESKIGENSWFA